MADRGDCALYVTLLAETHARMMLHLRSLQFFRPDFVGTRVFYLSGTSVLKDKGPHGLLELLTRGKTLLGLHFLAEGARNGEPGLYFGFAESGETLMRKTRSVGLDLAPFMKRGLIRLESRAPVETLPDATVQELMDMVSQHPYRRVFIDGLEPFAKEAIDPERTTRFLSALLNALRDQHITPLITEQTNTLFGPDLHSPIQGAEAIFDNLIFLRFVELNGRLRRLLSILKMRDSDNHPFLREFIISSKGLQVQEAYAALEGMMTGLPTHRQPKLLQALQRRSRKPGGRK